MKILFMEKVVDPKKTLLSVSSKHPTQVRNYIVTKSQLRAVTELSIYTPSLCMLVQLNHFVT